MNYLTMHFNPAQKVFRQKRNLTPRKNTILIPVKLFSKKEDILR